MKTGKKKHPHWTKGHEKFLGRAGMSPRAFLRKWRAGELADNTDNNMFVGEAMMLEPGSGRKS